MYRGMYMNTKMALEIEENITKDTNNCLRKNSTSLSGKLFSIDNLLSNSTKQTDTQTVVNEMGMSTLGNDNDDEEEYDDNDDCENEEEIEENYCKINGDQTF